MRGLYEKLERQPAWGLILLLLTPLIIWNCWNSPFLTYDDPLLFENPNLKLDAPWGDLFKRDAAEGFFFPLTMLSWKLDRFFGGQILNGHFGITSELQAWAASIRLTNLALHTLNGALIWLIARRLGASALLSVFVVAAYTLHPIACESVGWPIERKNVLAGFFSWAALFVYLGPFSWLRAAVATLLFGFALLCKPLALNLLPIVFMWEILNRPNLKTVQDNPVPAWKHRLALMAIWTALAAWATHTLLGTVNKNLLAPPGGNVFTALLTDVTILQRYLWNLSCPMDLSFFYGIAPVSTLASGTFWISFLGTAFWLAAMLWLPTPSNRKMAWFATGWFLTAWGTNWNLVGVNDLMHDRFIYLATPGCWIALGLAAHGAVEKLRALEASAPNLARYTANAPALGLLSTLVLALIWPLSSAARSQNFSDTLLLFQDAAHKEPRSASANCFLAQVYCTRLKVGDTEEKNRALNLAIHHFERGIASPDFDRYLRRPQAYSNVASLYLLVNRFDLAEEAATHALNPPPNTYIYDDDLAMGHFVMGRVCIEKKEYDQAAQHLETAFEKDPAQQATNIQLSKAYALRQKQWQAEQKFAEAKKCYLKAREALLRIPAGNPNYKDAQNLLAVLIAPPD